MDTLEINLHYKLISTFRTVLSPICTSIDPLPTYGNMSSFWQNTKDVILGLGPKIILEALEQGHIKNLMKFILGHAAKIFDANKFNDWRTLKKIVNLKFSMT